MSEFMSNDRMEIMAIAFARDTGYWAPFKDYPEARGARTDAEIEEARLAWNTWSTKHARIITRILDAVTDYQS